MLGPARYEDHLATGRPLPAETQAYLATLAPMIGDGSIGSATVVAATRSWTDAPLFVAHAESCGATSSPWFSSPSQQPSTRKSAEDWPALAPQQHADHGA